MGLLTAPYAKRLPHHSFSVRSEWEGV